MHIHGAGGYDVMDGTFESIKSMSKLITKHGYDAGRIIKS